MKKQFEAYSFVKQSRINTGTLVVGFSENFTCSQLRSVQSAHFGASNRQITLHTGVAYTPKGTTSFCTVSDDTRHDPPAIWAHLEPIVQHLVEKDGIEVLHIWSDGPTSQYRNKVNFFYFSRIQRLLGLEFATWNFFESGHGKGAADSIGGIIKRTADTAINTGRMITDASTFVDTVAPKTIVQMSVITSEDIAAKEAYLSGFSQLKPVTGTMKLHQLQMLAPSTLSVRDLSCFCSAPMSCSCLGARIVHFPQCTNAPSASLRPAITNATEVPTASADTRDSLPDVPTAAPEVSSAVHVSAMGDKATSDSVASARSVHSTEWLKFVSCHWKLLVKILQWV